MPPSPEDPTPPGTNLSAEAGGQGLTPPSSEKKKEDIWAVNYFIIAWRLAAETQQMLLAFNAIRRRMAILGLPLPSSRRITHFGMIYSLIPVTKKTMMRPVDRCACRYTANYAPHRAVITQHKRAASSAPVGSQAQRCLKKQNNSRLKKQTWLVTDIYLKPGSTFRRNQKLFYVDG